MYAHNTVMHTHTLPGELIPIRIGDRQNVEIELIHVLLSVLRFAQFLEDVRADGRGDPFAGVDA